MWDSVEGDVGKVKEDVGKCGGRHGVPQHTSSHTSFYSSPHLTHLNTLSHTSPHTLTHFPIPPQHFTTPPTPQHSFPYLYPYYSIPPLTLPSPPPTLLYTSHTHLIHLHPHFPTPQLLCHTLHQGCELDHLAKLEFEKIYFLNSNLNSHKTVRVH